MLALIPTLAMCVFLVMSAPYLKIIAVRFFEIEKDHVVLSVDLAEDTEAVAPIGPPPNPELAIAKIYQKLYDEEGFDWRNPPVIEYPEIKREEIRKEIKPVEVEWPLMRNVGLVELEKSSSN